MENLLQNKAKFFAQYWDQQVLTKIVRGENKAKITTHNAVCSNWKFVELVESYLELKPLSSITDEDAIEVAKIVSPMLFEGNGDDGGHFIDKSENESGWISVRHNRKIISIDIDLDGYVFKYHEDESYTRPSLAACGTDLLRSKGYALPWMGLSIEKQIAFGWIKLKTN